MSDASALTARQIRHVQRALNDFVEKYLSDVTRIRVDGNLGHATRKRVRMVKYYLGHGPDRDSYPGERFRRQLNHPRTTKYSSKVQLERAEKRRKRQREIAREERQNWRNQVGFATFQGKTVPEWMVFWLQKTVDAGWDGWVVSGVRASAHSIELCFGICGRPSCPGLCAGAGSNHNMEPGQGYPAGALDVSFYVQFGEIQRRIGSPLRNDLPNDKVHYSVSGH